MTEAAMPRGLLSIGEVLAELQPDFPDLSHSKVRFLEEKGLVEPRRTAAGYRKFTRDDVDRIRLILEFQRDRFMPLKAIGEYLDAVDRGLQPAPLPGGVPTAVLPAADSGTESFAPRPPARLHPEELMASARIDRKFLRALESFGLVDAADGYFDADDLEVAQLAASLAGYGIEPRHLRQFRTAADRETDLISQVTLPLRRHRAAESEAKADELAREISAVCVRLHTALVRSALGRAAAGR